MAEVSPTTIALDEAAARRVVLVQAIESTDERGKLLGEADREQAERAVLQHRPTREPPDPAWFLPARAAELLHVVEARSPALARLESRGPWADRMARLLPLLALAAGFTSDRLFNWQRTDLLSLPLVGVVAWNLAVYLLLATAALRARGRPAGTSADGLVRELAAVPSWFGRRAARVRESASARFHLLWWQVAGALESARLHKVLHLAAAAWALGIVLSIVATGLVTQFRVGWESTWLGPDAVHRILAVMALPARLLGIEGFSVDEVRRLQFGSGAAAGQGEAQRWALIYIVFLVATVVLPRLALAAWARWRARVRGRRLVLDVSGEYFERVMARVSPASFAIHVQAGQARLAQAVTVLLAQAGPLSTPQGDSLTVTDDAQAADFVWRVVGSGEDGALPAAGPGDGRRKLLLLCERADDAPALRARTGADVLALDDCAACWPLESALRDWLGAQVVPHRRPGMQRLLQAWATRNDKRWADAMRLVGDALFDCAQDRQDVPGFMPGAKEREAATAALMTRLQQRLDRLHDELLALHAARTQALRHSLVNDPGFRGLAGQAGAGAAGALAGALAGAKIDLVTGGLTMGAGAALGALLGGAGVFTAARWWLLGGTVRLGDEQVQALAELLVMQYLAVIHAGRSRDLQDGRVPPQWKSEAVAAVAAQADALRAAAKRAREGDVQAAAAMAGLLRQATWAALRGLYPALPPLSPAAASAP